MYAIIIQDGAVWPPSSQSPSRLVSSWILPPTVCKETNYYGYVLWNSKSLTFSFWTGIHYANVSAYLVVSFWSIFGPLLPLEGPDRRSICDWWLVADCAGSVPTQVSSDSLSDRLSACIAASPPPYTRKSHTRHYGTLSHPLMKLLYIFTILQYFYTRSSFTEVLFLKQFFGWALLIQLQQVYTWI